MEVLSIDAGLPVEVTHEYFVRQSPGPIRQRAVIFEGVRRHFRLPFDVLSISQKNTAMALFRTMKGKAGRFLYTPPDEVMALECKFKTDEQSWTSHTASQRSIGLEFETAF